MSQVLWNELIIQRNLCIILGDFGIEIKAYQGVHFNVHYFKVTVVSLSENSYPEPQSGFLRVDQCDKELQKELAIRKEVPKHRMVAPLLWEGQANTLSIHINSFRSDPIPQENGSTNIIVLPESKNTPENTDFLEESHFLECDSLVNIKNALICLSLLPKESKSLAEWLTQNNSIDEVLNTLIQFCQFANYLNQQGWCFVQINPQLIEINKPIVFYDLIGVFPEGRACSGISGRYCPPEIAIGCAIDQQTSSYLLGLILYQAIHCSLPKTNIIDGESPLFVSPIPGIYQILRLCLSRNGDRLSLQALLNLLIQCKKDYQKTEIYWEFAGKSTLGLSIDRLHNEDTYGVRQQHLSDQTPFILGVVADGMGGMEKGEIASKIAVKELVESSPPSFLKNLDQGHAWLSSLLQKVNYEIVKSVQHSGTTLSSVLAVGRELTIAHIGDSRIFLIRNGYICQLSEDHSLIAALLSSGQISYTESLKHPDRNVLIKSLGSQAVFNLSHIQTLKFFGEDYKVFLEDRDIILICSDGVWDLITPSELCEMFTQSSSIAGAVESVIGEVLSRGALDNATILALSCKISEPNNYVRRTSHDS